MMQTSMLIEHKKGNFLFSQVKILKNSEFKDMKTAFYRLSLQIVSSRSMNQYLQTFSAVITSGLCIMAAKKVLNSDISSPNSVYNGMFIGNSIRHKGWKNQFPSSIAIN